MTMTLNLPDEVAMELKRRAAQKGTSETELVSKHLEDWLIQSDATDEEVRAITQRIISEDRELLERLA